MAKPVARVSSSKGSKAQTKDEVKTTKKNAATTEAPKGPPPAVRKTGPNVKTGKRVYRPCPGLTIAINSEAPKGQELKKGEHWCEVSLTWVDGKGKPITTALAIPASDKLVAFEEGRKGKEGTDALDKWLREVDRRPDTEDFQVITATGFTLASLDWDVRQGKSDQLAPWQHWIKS